MGTKSKFDKIVTGVLGIVQNSKKEVLFIKQRKGPYAGSWLLPGGSIEKNETCVQAVIREVNEETGINIKNPEFVNINEMFGEWEEGKYHLLMFGFKDYTEDEIPKGFEGDNVDGIKWFNPFDIDLHPTDKLILREAGYADFTDKDIEESLKADRIIMNSYISR
ncbi:8-oxo-dGTP diphosphatase [Clostridium acidisoli DSM 12555]|uniref:8-oxo-dGTP diphosphatase n=1 Tax=Clostridium acidisoli DSM 12555 TaxID=1121291 RepID=A0A1W1XT29_9CLOT|nr:NUDIX hydrolase [Clostridium acidisoli]SMC26995.1 8-oxo-dGTP diphosphatase [Clostridium acidisoli DSM 12555]